MPLTPEARERLMAKTDQVRVRQLAERNPVFGAALTYRNRGWHHIPIAPDGKIPLVPWKTFQERPPSTMEMIGWWSKYPKARIGLITGRVPGLVVVDVDPRNGGKVDGLDIPQEAVSVRTPSGGTHYYFSHPGQAVPNRAGIRPGVDIRGDGGYVLAPPSPGYTADGPIDGQSLPAAPRWIWESPRSVRPESRGGSWFAETFAQATAEGQRNATATQLAGYLIGKGLRNEDAQAILEGWAARCVPPFPADELARVVTSIGSREAAKREEEPALRLLPPSALTVQETRFVIDALVPAGTLTLLYGKDKGGKTLLALEMIRAIRTGQPFLGRFPAVQGNVIALLLDDPPGLVRDRLVDDLGLSDEGLLIATQLTADTDNPERLLRALAEEARNRRPAFILVDALYVLLQGAKQLYDAGEMRPLMRGLDRIAEESGAAVLLVHHPRKSDGEAAGSFAIRASAKSILRLSKPREERDEDGDVGDTTRRVLRVEGKFLPEAKYALDFAGPGRWTLLGDTGQVRVDDLGAQVLAAVSREPGLTGDELANRLSRRKGDIVQALNNLAKDGKVQSKKEIPPAGRGRPKRTWWSGSSQVGFEISPPSPRR